jgi:hypothetical protein
LIKATQWIAIFVKVNIFLRFLLDLLNLLNFFISKEWKDDRLAYDAPFAEISLSMKMLDLIWKPGMIISYYNDFLIKFFIK